MEKLPLPIMLTILHYCKTYHRLSETSHYYFMFCCLHDSMLKKQKRLASRIFYKDTKGALTLMADSSIVVLRSHITIAMKRNESLFEPLWLLLNQKSKRFIFYWVIAHQYTDYLSKILSKENQGPSFLCEADYNIALAIAEMDPTLAHRLVHFKTQSF